MELLQQPDIKSTYEKCKYKVKYWEHAFKKKYKRLPSKLDIREADKEIRLAYKTYFNLKSAALEQSFQDIDGFNSDDENVTTNTSAEYSLEAFGNVSNINLNDSAALGCSLLEAPPTESEDTNTENQNNELEDSNIENQNTDNTWGSHLNNVNAVHKKEEKKEKLNINSSFTQKLFKNSVFSKRNPRKSLSISHRKSETNLNSSKSSLSFNQSTSTADPEIVTNPPPQDEPDIPINIFNSDKVKITNIVEPVQTKSLNLISSVLDDRFKTSRNLDSGWIKRVAQSTGTKLINKNITETNFGLSQQLNSKKFDGSDYDSDDIIGDSDDEETKMHFTKRRKIDAEPIQTTSEAIEKLNFSNVFTTQKPDLAINVAENVKAVEEVSKNKSVESVIEEPQYETPAKDLKQSLEEEYKEDVYQPIVTKHVVVKSLPTRKSVRQRKTLVELEIDDDPPNPFEEDAEDPEFEIKGKDIFNFDGDIEDGNEEKPVEKSKKTKATKPKKKNAKSKKSDETDDESEEPKSKKKRARSSPKSKVSPKAKRQKVEKPKTSPKGGRKKKVQEVKEEEPEEEEEQATYELEYSIKPRIVTVPRDPNLINIIKKAKTRAPIKNTDEMKDDETGVIIKDKKQQQFDKLKKKMETGNLNENFVQINLKKKMFVRGKKTMNFSKYKKKMWKQHQKTKSLTGPDMDMGGCDGGMLTCFNCGQVGHFAQSCKAIKGEALLPLTAADQEYCPYPTLEEASQMAKESNLVIRKPKAAGENEDNEEVVQSSDAEENDSDSDNNSCNTEFTEDPFADDDEDDALLAETIKLEEYVNKIDVQEYIDSKRSVKPYYNLKDDGSVIDTPEEVFEALKMFGHSSFRPGQERAIMRILSGQSTLVTLSTGSGKSFCYQLPAFLYAKREPCISLIISPLVSLMEDQVTGIPAFLRAACLHTNKTKIQREKILEAIKTGSLDILLVSPEAVVAGEKSNGGFGSLLRKLPPVAFACIDEAHCVSQWSHNFRPSYLMICRILKERLGIHTILGLTATATRATSDSIIEHLSIPDGRDGIISDTPLPDNLRLTVSKDGNRDHALLGLLLSERFENLKSVIVYCTRRQECERIAAFLRTSLKNEKPTEANSKKRKKLSLQAEPYHAGLAASRRRTIQKNFMSGELRIVVATVAFGMGINKSDIRAVIHYNLPKNFESYVQEVGRAGRDGLPAHCHLFLDSQGRDENELQRHVFSDSIDRHVIRKLLQRIFVPCSCKKICPKHEVAFSIQETVLALDIPEENISTLLCYLELHGERYIEVLSPGYITCKVIAYGGGGNQIRKAAKDCPPLAMALAMFGEKDNDENIFEFPVVDVAAAMGWDSGICKHKLKNLEWTTENNQPKRSLLTIRFTNLGFRLLAPGNLKDTQLDETLDRLYQRVVDQERTSLLQLHALHDTVIAVAGPTYRTCISDEITERELKLKACIREYFDNPNPLACVKLIEKKCDEGLIACDVRAIVSMYRDNSFTGRAVARIFYGISSPNYPAVIWGRCKFWRAHINTDFNAICRIATREIIKMR